MRTSQQRGGTPRQEQGRQRSPGPTDEPCLLRLQRMAGNAAVGAFLRNVAGRSTGGSADRARLAAVARSTGSQAGVLALQRFYDAEDFTKDVPDGGGVPVTWSGKRPSVVSEKITPTGVGGRPATATPQAYRQADPGHVVHTNSLLGYDGGHVIGLHLGGANVSDNVVPMYPGFNRGPWKNMEDATKAHIGAHHGTYRMTVSMTYTAATAPEVPTTFTVKRELQGVGGAWSQAIPQETLSQPADIPVTPRLGAHQEAVVRPAGPGRLATPTVDAPPGQFLTGGQSFGDYVGTHQHLPPSAKAHYPDDPAHRPYEILDIQYLNQAVAGAGIPMATVMSTFTDFSAEQRTLILQTNLARNGGRLRSDDPRDPHQDLDQRGAANAPEIDHIVPKSLGGSNFFSNARVVSWQLNNKEARVKPLSGLVALEKLPVPALGGPLRDNVEHIVEQFWARHRAASVDPQEIVAWAALTWTLSSSVAAVRRFQRLVVQVLDELVTAGSLAVAGGRYRKA